MDSHHLARILLANMPFETLKEFGESSSLLLAMKDVLAAKKPIPNRVLQSELAKQGKYAVGKEYNPQVGDDVDFYD